MARAYGAAKPDLLLIRDLIDQLAQQRVLRRGLLLRCVECSDLDLHPIERLGQTNTCQRCGHATALTRDAWRHPQDEPHWFYGLHPAVGNIVNTEGGIQPTQLAAELRTRPGFIADVPEIEAARNGARLAECDLLALVEDRVIIAEVKKRARLSGQERAERARKLVLLADAPRSDEILLATADQTWDTTPAPFAPKWNITTGQPAHPP